MNISWATAHRGAAEAESARAALREERAFAPAQRLRDKRQGKGDTSHDGQFGETHIFHGAQSSPQWLKLPATRHVADVAKQISAQRTRAEDAGKPW
ncbi:hypothetical protein [Segniliparus rotundus]|uniref:hypothetical protein n=1 Tax=Segniliparus rotundus TaxID=286802 RepID=UPI00059C4A6C|nr:hypothetical protein [Segniliparus rotundus]